MKYFGYKTVCIMGKSGSGKSTLIENICKNSKYHYVKSNTTRKVREDDPRDKDTHVFVSEEQYQKDLKDGKIIALYEAPSGYHSYTTIDNFSKNKINIYAIDPKAFINLSIDMTNTYGIYLDIPEDVRQERLHKREPNKIFDLEEHLDWKILMKHQDSVRWCLFKYEENKTPYEKFVEDMSELDWYTDSELEIIYELKYHYFPKKLEVQRTLVLPEYPDYWEVEEYLDNDMTFDYKLIYGKHGFGLYGYNRTNGKLEKGVFLKNHKLSVVDNGMWYKSSYWTIFDIGWLGLVTLDGMNPNFREECERDMRYDFLENIFVVMRIGLKEQTMMEREMRIAEIEYYEYKEWERKMREKEEIPSYGPDDWTDDPLEKERYWEDIADRD